MAKLKAKTGRPPSPPVGAVIEKEDGTILTWNGKKWEPLESWETPEDFVRWLESTTWPKETDRATVPVPPAVIVRAIRVIRMLLELLKQRESKGA